MLTRILSRFFTPTTPTEPEFRRSGDGLINDTWLVGDYVLQRLHPIFEAEVNLDIQALVPVLRNAEVPVPTIYPSRRTDGGAGKPSITVGQAGQSDAFVDMEVDEEDWWGVWRLLECLTGQTLHRVAHPRQAESAARALANFHGALLHSQHEFAFSRLGVHDTPKHFDALQEAVETHLNHRLHRPVLQLNRELKEQWESWGESPELPRRIGHGDPKISNFLFDDADQVVGIIDLDTMAWTTLDLELGDACRSWCSTTDESADEPHFDVDIFRHAITGYADTASPWLTTDELQSFATAPERICLELSARFAADALNESYFGWDRDAHDTAGDHNLARARNQLALARAAHAALPQLKNIVRELDSVAGGARNT